MNCKEFEEKIFGIDDLSPAGRQKLKDHLSQCTNDHKAEEWMLEKLTFTPPTPANPERLTADIMQTVSTTSITRSLHWRYDLLRYAAALIAFALSAAFAFEVANTSPINPQSLSVTKSESNAAFIKRIRRKPEASTLIAEIRACRAKCLNPPSEGCEACANLLINLNNNSK